jgi:hypothetical protein
MSKFLPCKSVCPVVAELRHDLANRDTEIRRLQMELERRDRRISNLIEGKRDNEKRIAKIRQAAFGIVDWGIDD